MHGTISYGNFLLVTFLATIYLDLKNGRATCL